MTTTAAFNARLVLEAPAGILHSFPHCDTCYSDDIGVTLENMQSVEGWWRADNKSATFIHCLRTSHCLGGAQSVQCAGHRIGPLCTLCEVSACALIVGVFVFMYSCFDISALFKLVVSVIMQLLVISCCSSAQQGIRIDLVVQEGYRAVTIDSQCEECPEKQAAAGLAILFLLLLILA